MPSYRVTYTVTVDADSEDEAYARADDGKGGGHWQASLASAPVLQILHVRDPDSSCDVRVWLDGVQLANFDMVDVDPGAGYDRSDWRDRVAEARKDASPFGLACLQALESLTDSEYLTGD